jgi:NADH-quinone oxidoreductase subunit N
VFSLNLLISSNDFVSVYLAIEMQALAFYILAAFKKKSVYSTESGLKYFILGAFSSGLLLFSFSLIYGVLGTTNLTEIRYFCLDDSFVGNELVKVGLIFLVGAFLFKVAAFPFHMWSPDVYEGAPTSTTIFFAVVPKLALVAVFLRIFNYSFFKFGEIWSLIMVVSGVFSIVLGGFVAFKQDNLKRLLAYSGVGHVGFILLAFSTKSFTGVQVALFYSLIYILTSVLVWGGYIGGMSKQPRRRGEELSEVLEVSLNHEVERKSAGNVSMWSGMYSINPGLALAIGFGFFSLAGIPPLVGFSAKAFVFFSLINSSNYLGAMIGVLVSVVSASYYIGIIKTVYFEKDKNWLYYEGLGRSIGGVISLSSFLLVFLFFSPTIFVLLTELMSLSS